MGVAGVAIGAGIAGVGMAAGVEIGENTGQA
jgi:hypothetical protein